MKIAGGVERSVRIARIYFVAILVAYATVLCVASQPPALDDYPDWVYQGVLFGKVIRHHAASAYALKHYPVPNSLTTIGIGLLTLVMAWQAAAKAWLVCVLAIFAAGCLRLERRLKIAGSPVLYLMPTAIVVGWDFWLGHVSFLLGLALMVWMMAHLLGERRQDWKTALFLVVIFFAHFIPCAAAILILLELSRQERSWRVGAAVPVVLLIAWYAVARDKGEDVVHTSLVHLVPAVLMCGYLLLPQRMQVVRKGVVLGIGVGAVFMGLVVSASSRHLLQFMFWTKLYQYVDGFGVTKIAGEDGVTAFLLPRALQGRGAAFLLAALGMVLAAAVAVLVIATVREHLRRGGRERFLAVSGLIFLAGFVMLPNNSLGVAGIDGRALTLGLCVVLFLVGSRWRRWVWSAAALSVVVCGLNLCQMAALQRRAELQLARRERTRVPLGIAISHPLRRLYYYERLEQGVYEGPIFPTGIFRWNRTSEFER